MPSTGRSSCWPALATVIASQAVITGAFSMTQQAVQLGLLPRIDIQRTSRNPGRADLCAADQHHADGRALLFLLVMFRSSDALTSAYGIAVTGAMFVGTSWPISLFAASGTGRGCAPWLLLVPLGLIEAVFMASNLTKCFPGAWMPLVFGGLLILVMRPGPRARTS